MNRLQYHFEPKTGWINDPNGLVWFQGRYHSFFQFYPDAPTHGPMHWGHAVSDDLLHWEELPVALYPDMPYDNGRGCFSGTSIVKDGRLYLFYTSVSEKLGQTQSLAYSDDGIHFTKYEGNPIIRDNPVGTTVDFRDPSVAEYDGRYYMVLGTGVDGTGKAPFFVSDDLYNWDYVDLLLDSREYGPVIECPNLFRLKDKDILLFSVMKQKKDHVRFNVGTFDKKTFHIEQTFLLDSGPDFYAPQTFLDGKGRRIMIGWLYSWNKPKVTDRDYAGALSIPRELRYKDGILYNYPVEEALHLLTDSDEHVRIENNSVICSDGEEDVVELTMDNISDIKILRDTMTVEVFVNGGERSASFWIQNP